MKNSITTLVAFFVFSISFAGINAKTKIDHSKINHKIELGAFQHYVPVKLVEVMRSLQGVTPVKVDGKSIYYTAAYQDEYELQKDLPMLQSLGFKDARHVIDYKNKIYAYRDFQYYLEKGKIDENSETTVVRIWK